MSQAATRENEMKTFFSKKKIKYSLLLVYTSVCILNIAMPFCEEFKFIHQLYKDVIK